MKKILLACSGGYSTSMLVERMKTAAKQRDLVVEIDAVAESAIEKEINNVSIIMLGPQIGHAISDISKKYGHLVPVAVIEMRDYGMMNGENVLNKALELVEAFEAGK